MKTLKAEMQKYNINIDTLAQAMKQPTATVKKKLEGEEELLLKEGGIITAVMNEAGSSLTIDNLAE